MYVQDSFLNQVHTGHRLACAWFLKIVSVRISVCVCVCVLVCVCVYMSTFEAINNKWCYVDPIQLVEQVLQVLYGNCSSHYC